MKSKSIFSGLAICLITAGLLLLGSCGSGGGNGITGGDTGPWAGISAGLYQGAPSSLTSASVPLNTPGTPFNGYGQSVPAGNFAELSIWLVSRAGSGSLGSGGEYTLLLDADYTISYEHLSDGTLTIIGKGGRRTLTNASSASDSMLMVGVGGTSTLILGNNITLKGSASSSTSANLVTVRGGSTNNGTFVMLDGSEITGHSTSAGSGAVYLDGSTFTMHGGTITGNHSSSTSANAVGGVYIGLNGTFTMNDGSITNNTSFYSGVSSPADIYVWPGGMSAGTYYPPSTFNHNGGTYGVKLP